MTQKLINTNDVQNSQITNAKVVSISGSKFSDFTGTNFDGVSRLQLITDNTSNLLVNGGFDNDGSIPPSGWTDIHSSPLVMTSESVAVANHSYLTLNGQSIKMSGATSKMYGLRQDVNLSAAGFDGPNGNSSLVARNKVYLFGCCRYGNEPTGTALEGTVKLTLFEDSVPTQISELALNSPTVALFTWSSFQLSVTPSSSTSNITARVEIGADGSLNNQGFFYFDNLILLSGQTGSFDGV